MNLKFKDTALFFLLTAMLVVAGCAAETPEEAADAVPVEVPHVNAMLDLWEEGTTAFGVYVPSEAQLAQAAAGPRGGRGARGAAGAAGARGARGRGQRTPPVYTVEIGRQLAENPLYDYAFLNLEGSYSSEAVTAIAEGLSSPTAVSRKALLVRIPSLDNAGPEVTMERIQEIYDAGGDGVVMPHVRNLEEAEMLVGFFRDASGGDIWSPQNPGGEKVGMLMLEDPEVVEQLDDIIALGNYSVLACGIGSMTGAVRNSMEGDDEAAIREAASVRAQELNMQILDAATEAGMADMITANANNVERQVEEGFLALLMNGAGADDAIRLGLAAAGRPVPETAEAETEPEQ